MDWKLSEFSQTVAESIKIGVFNLKLRMRQNILHSPQSSLFMAYLSSEIRNDRLYPGIVKHYAVGFVPFKIPFQIIAESFSFRYYPVRRNMNKICIDLPTKTF